MRNCFISYHHEYDYEYVKVLQSISKSKFNDYSIKQDFEDLTEETIYKKIRKKLYNTSVTIVLIGEKTYKRKWVDWEIWASLRRYKGSKNFVPNGLLGIFLPNSNYYIPERFQDNIESGYAVTMNWRDLKHSLDDKIEEAFSNRESHRNRIDNSRDQMKRNYWL